MMERMPADCLRRTTRAALEAAVRRLSSSKASIASANERRADERPTPLPQDRPDEAEQTAMLMAARRAQDAQKDLQVQLESAQAELREAREQMQARTTEMDNFRNRDHEVKMQQRLMAEKEQSLRGELDQVRAEAAKHASERMRLEEQVRIHNVEKMRLESDLVQERDRIQGNQEHLAKERQALTDEVGKTRKEYMEMLEKARQKADEERKSHATTMEKEKDNVLEVVKNAGLLEGQVAALTAEKNLLHNRVSQLEEQIREAECSKGRNQKEQEALKADIEKMKQEAEEITKTEVSKRVELEKKLQEKKPKCGCIVQ
jgi:chromosome segregation ATPase